MDDRTPADPGRTELARGWYDEGLAPEHWAAKYAHEIGASSLDGLTYADPALDAWIHRAFEVMRDPAQLAAARAQYLTEDERRAIAKRSDEDF